MPERPNILLIMSDQHHTGYLGCAGDPVVETPALDGLAADGVRFTNTYCPFPLCGPSRMAFMTGRHPYAIQNWNNVIQLHSDVPTFAHGLLAAGYATVLSGRMHFVGPDQRHGFQHRLVGDVPESVHLEAGWKLGRVLGDLIDTPGMSLAGVVKSGPGRTGYHAYDELVTATTVDWLHRHEAADDPFLLVVGYAAPHCPFVAPPEDFARAAARIRVDDLPEPGEEPHPLLRAWRTATQVDPRPPLDAQWRARVAYYGLCAFLDRQVGAVLEALRASGQADNTLIVYTSDHGEMLGEHGMWWKSVFYDGSMRVPLLVSWPGHLSPGTVAHNVSLMDIGATLLDLAGAPPLPAASGRSLRPLLHGDAATWDDTVFAEYVYSHTGDVVPARMVKRGGWKYCYYHGLPPQLFHLADDPGETRNRADDPACAEIRAALHALVLAGWDPDAVQAHEDAWPETQRLLKSWIDAAQPAEPDPLWFTEPLDNWIAPVTLPASDR